VRPTVYLETTIPSYLTARPSNDLAKAARQAATREWWDNRRPAFECLISQLVVRECQAGDTEAAARRMDAINGIRVLELSEPGIALAALLLNSGAIPKAAADDAFHVGVCAVHGVDYLLTWNFAHIANAQKALAIRAACARMGYACPVICTPDELMEDK
jgi:hypothetical protein